MIVNQDLHHHVKSFVEIPVMLKLLDVHVVLEWHECQNIYTDSDDADEHGRIQVQIAHKTPSRFRYHYKA